MVIDSRSLHKSPINKCVSEDSIFGSTLFLLYSNNNLGDFIFRNVLHTDGVTTYSEFFYGSLICGKILLPFETESGFLDTEDCDKKSLANINAGKFQFVSYDHSNNTEIIRVKNMRTCRL